MIDCKIDGGKEVVQNAPRLINYLCDDCKAHFEGLKSRLDAVGIRYATAHFFQSQFILDFLLHHFRSPLLVARESESVSVP